MKTLLVNLDLGYDIDWFPTRKNNLGIGYLASVIVDFCDVQVLDGYFVGEEKVLSIIQNSDYDVIGFSFTGIEMSSAYRRAENLREAFDNPVTRAISLAKESHPNAAIVLGGYTSTFWDEDILQMFPVDYICRGESEVSFPLLIQSLIKRHGTSGVTGISFLRNGLIQRNDTTLPDISKLPLPYRELVDPEKDWTIVSSSRGCYGKCSFCNTYSLYGEPKGSWWRYREPASVLQELQSLAMQGCRNIQFSDDNFIARDPARAIGIATGIIDLGLNLNLRLDCRVNDVSVDVLKILKEAGLSRLFMGCESGSQQDLKLFNKGTTVSQNIRAVKIAEKLDIDVDPGIIMFHPLSTLKSIEDNLSFIRQMHDDPGIMELGNELYVCKGTGIYRYFDQAGILNSPLTTYHIVDDAARSVYELFMEYVNEYIRKARTKSLATETKEIIYQRDKEHLQTFELIIRDVRRNFL